MQSTSPRSNKTLSATIFQPDGGKTFSFMGNTVTYKSTREGEGSRIYEVLAPAGAGVPPLHTHPWDEWFYVLEGEVEMQLGDRAILATPGYAVNLPAGVAHTFQAKSPQARFLVMVSNAGADRYIEELAAASQERQLTPDEVMAIGQKYRICLAN